MSDSQEHPAAPERRQRAHTVARRIALPLSLAAISVTAAVASGSPAVDATGAGGTVSPVAPPPTAAEAEQWDVDFHASEPTARAKLPALEGKAPGGRLFPDVKVLSLYGAAGGFGIIGRKS